MKVAIIGLWHLGCVTAASMAQKGYQVLGIANDENICAALNQGKAPIYEPGLDELLAQGLTKGNLQFSSEIKEIDQSDIVWVTIDTPVDDDDIADVKSVLDTIEKCFPYLKENATVIISSQLPVGSTRQVINKYKLQFPNHNVSFVVSPENLRLGKAIQIFTQPDRIIVGVDSENDKKRLIEFISTITPNIIWMSIESAEMTKHALNSFLATSVVFINELAVLCEEVGANAREVEQGLKSEERIGSKAYLRPGSAIAGGTLARDVNYLVKIGMDHHVPTPFFSSLLKSNHQHKKWAHNRLLKELSNLKDKTITTLGLTYKTGTDTLRRSRAIETCRWLYEQGAKVVAYDPLLKVLPDDLHTMIELKPSLESALQASDCVIIETEWPEFTAISRELVLQQMRTPRIIDANGFLAKTLKMDPRIHYFMVGSTS